MNAAERPGTRSPASPNPANGGDARSTTGPFAALHHRNYRLFFVGQLVSVAGGWMQTVAQQWLVYDLTRSPAWLGIVSGASAIPYVVCSVWGGKAADQYSRRNILVATQAAMMAQALTMTFLVMNPWVAIQPWHIAALSAVGGVVNAFNMPAQHALVPDLVSDRSVLGNAIALNSLRFNSARFVGPIMAGAVLVKWGAGLCFLVNALSYIAVVASLLMMRLPSSSARRGVSSTWGGFAYLWRTPAVLRIVALVAIGSMFGWSVSTLYPAVAAQLGQGAGGYSTMVSANGLGAALGGLAQTFFGQRIPRLRLVFGGALVFAAGLLVLSAVRSYPFALATLVVSGFAMIIFGINCNTAVQERVPDDMRGRVMAIYSLVFFGLMPVGGLQIGFLAETLGDALMAVRLNATVCAVAPAVVLLTARRRREGA